MAWLLGLLAPFATAIIFAIACIKAWKWRWLFHACQLLSAFLSPLIVWIVAMSLGLMDDPGDDPGPVGPVLAYVFISIPGSLMFYIFALLISFGYTLAPVRKEAR